MPRLEYPPFLSRLFQEFHCRGCGNDEAYRSRPRGIFEKALLPIFMMRPVRCARCYHRSHIFRTVRVPERAALAAKASAAGRQGTSDTGDRVA